MSEGAAVDYDSMSSGQFASEMAAKLESAQALFSVEKLGEAESVWNSIAVTRRSAMAMLTKSGPDLVKAITDNREFAVACADLLGGIEASIVKLDSLKEILEHAQWRMMVALAHREDMQAVYEEAKKQH